jgi:hypothetical protein
MLDIADSSEAKLAKDPIDNAEAAEPMLPMLSTEPMLPIDRNELVEPMDRIELCDAMLHREVSGSDEVMDSCCQHQWRDGGVMDLTREDLLDLYDTTIVSIQHPEHGCTDPALVAIERKQGAVVLTAWNPGLERPTEAENRQANERMLGELLATGHEVWRADGRAPDGTFEEEGWIVWGLALDQALVLALRFGQFAVYTFDDSGLRVTVACPDDSPR